MPVPLRANPYTVNTLYTDIRYNDKICYNDNLNRTIPQDGADN